MGMYKFRGHLHENKHNKKSNHDNNISKQFEACFHLPLNGNESKDIHALGFRNPPTS
jgi:hypothetical protein